MRSEPRPVSQDEVLLSWYRSERDVDWQKEHRRPFEQARPDCREQDVANEGIRYLRGALLQCRSTTEPFFDVYATAWFAVEITLDELAGATAVDCFGLASCRTVRDVAGILPALRRTRTSVATLKYPLLVVSESQDAKLLLLDGYNRAAGLIHSNETSPIPAYWGVCENLRHWDYHR
jgi:hypothetical protein